jgi:hypothetical protein
MCFSSNFVRGAGFVVVVASAANLNLNASQLVQAKKHLSNFAYSAIISTFLALTLGYVFVAREQMCDCSP